MQSTEDQRRSDSTELASTPLLIHVGYHKTASSFLQKSVFINEDCGFTMPPRHEIALDVVLPRPFCYRAEEVRAKYQLHFDEAKTKGLLPVLSHERLSGYPPSGGYDSQTVANRLAATFPEALILIVIREQIALIQSMYSQYITDGGEMDLTRYMSTPQPNLTRMPSFSFDNYKFHHLIGYYQQLFGKEKVLALPFELLKKDADAFFHRLAAFCGRAIASPSTVDTANERRPITMQICQRWINRLFSENQLSRLSLYPVYGVVGRFGKWAPTFNRFAPRKLEKRLRRRQAKQIKRAIRKCYCDSNRITSELIGINLATYGYDISAEQLVSREKSKNRKTGGE